MKISKNTRNGFTLIELLVVISIIALLSSVILASLNGARQKGQMASVITFTTYNYHKLGSNVIVMYNFNDSTNPLADSSGNNINATCTGPCSYSQNTPIGVGGSISLSTGSTMSTGNITYPCSSGCSYTVSIWLNPATLPSLDTNLITTGSQYSRLHINGPQITVGFITLNYNLPVGQWTNITYGYDSQTGILVAYVNGVLKTTTSTSFSIPNNQIILGAMSSSGGPLLLDDFVIYNQSLTASAVQKLYADGLKTHPNLAEK